MDSALGFTPVFSITSNPSHDLLKHARGTLRLVIAVKQLFDASCHTTVEVLSTTRIVVFFLMIVYIEGLCAASHELANELYAALSKPPKDCLNFAIRVYLHVVDTLLSLQDRNSLMQDIFANVQPRLIYLKDLLQQFSVVKLSPQLDLSSPHELGSQPFQVEIMIDLLHDTRRNKIVFPVSALLHSDFYEATSTNYPTTDGFPSAASQHDQGALTDNHETPTDSTGSQDGVGFSYDTHLTSMDSEI